MGQIIVVRQMRDYRALEVFEAALHTSQTPVHFRLIMVFSLLISATISDRYVATAFGQVPEVDVFIL